MKYWTAFEIKMVSENSKQKIPFFKVLILFCPFVGKSSVQIQSETLERLLEALDIRHLAGWYHPAMRMQEQLNVIQGINSELRAQNRELRYLEFENIFASS